MSAYGDYQNEIYFNGLRGIRPKLPVDFKSLEAKAAAALPGNVLSYVQGGCGDERTQEFNASAFQRWGLMPRMMIDASQRDLSIDLFGMKLPTPLFMCPIGVIGLCAQDGRAAISPPRAPPRVAACRWSPQPCRSIRSKPSLPNSAPRLASFNSIRRRTSPSPKVSSIAPRPPASKPLW
jgi:FMN-dependent dehydrogenase